jgi:hypothetical protein
MQKHRDMLWTWLLPEGRTDRFLRMDEQEWKRYGGKWIIFDRKTRIEELAGRLAPYIDSGRVVSAKYWNEDPGAICVYSLDKDRESICELLKKLGAGDARVWEYDYAWDKNLQSPASFMYSWFLKFRTILRSYGMAGSMRLVREVLRPRDRG